MYAALFGASVVVIGAIVYWLAIGALERQLEERIKAEANQLKNEYATEGWGALVAAIGQHGAARAGHFLDYGVFDAKGARRAGDLPQAPLSAGWFDITAASEEADDQGEAELTHIWVVPLSKDLWLAVGDDRNQIDEIGSAILEAFAFGLLLTVALAFAGGLILSGAFLARVGAISSTAEGIIHGDLTRRIPRRGKGDDLDDLAGTLNRMLDRVAGLMATLHHVSNDIAHDLRTPLGRLRQRLDTALNSAHTVPEYEKAVQRAIDDVDSVLETFAALLRIAQIEIGLRRAGFRQFSLSSVAATVFEAFGPSAEESGHAFSARIAPDVTAFGDKELVTQMLVNLTENAIHHTPVGTPMELGLEDTPRGPCLWVADHGPGVPSEERERIFQKFYRLERSRTTPGTGLGLSMVAAVAELHDVRVTVEDNWPGLRIALKFPLQKTRSRASDQTCTPGRP